MVKAASGIPLMAMLAYKMQNSPLKCSHTIGAYGILQEQIG